MNKNKFILFLILSIAAPVSSYAQLDLDKEVFNIPDTHNEKPYIWNVMRNPKDFELALQYASNSGPESEISFSVLPVLPPNIEVHVFVTDEDLHMYRHIKPLKAGDGKYLFKFNAPASGKYRFEVVFKTEKGWVDLRRDMKMKAAVKVAEKGARPGDEDYQIKLKLIPKRAYAGHVTTFLYEISYKGEPLKGLEKIDGSDMQLATWDEDLKEFIYARPQQNLGGPQVAVSVVFMRSGRHAVFAEFKHRGVMRRVESVVNVLMEPRQGSFIDNLRPGD